ncbi:alpha-(1-2)-phosphatidylinositol mannosyltransferase [Streptomyces sp. CB03234]|uniref:glycosyltransferase family 4 protein n=1 Tax=Streptomyces sp. (strain CB03234) TaxID=1703937 RepID=UPI00093D8895|nr:glycosyltransferase family 4 protein [Streptomyces sp. CB03234]OKK06799.1 alpha-(1-2)-phosphatidylinositol mannosyltransferase [Streptomyces sp. CB03234]
MHRTLVVTNDFPPRQGGIETFVKAMTDRFPPGGVVVHTSAEAGGAVHDAGLPYPVVRDRTRMLLPTPRVTARAVALAREYGCDSVWFGAAAPLGLMGGRLRREAGVRRLVATTHGHEVWWARTPGARAVFRRIGAGVDVVTYLGASTRAPIGAALGPDVRMARLVPGVDAGVFRPGLDAGPVRRRYGLGDAPVVLCAARLVARKGQDILIRALPAVRERVPGVRLLLVGSGPYESRLRRLTAEHGVTGAVVFAGGQAHAELPSFYAAADVFAMPCRSRKRGLEVEGLGIVYLEAAAAGLPALVGDSGGAPDAVRDGETGHVVDGRDAEAVTERLVELLRDRQLARVMGAKGRNWVREEWSWDRTYDTLLGLLDAGGRSLSSWAG